MGLVYKHEILIGSIALIYAAYFEDNLSDAFSSPATRSVEMHILLSSVLITIGLLVTVQYSPSLDSLT